MFRALRFSVAYIEDGYNVNSDVFNRLVPTKLIIHPALLVKYTDWYVSETITVSFILPVGQVLEDLSAGQVKTAGNICTCGCREHS